MERLSFMLENSNLMRYLPSVIVPAIGDTLIMVFVSAALSIFFGIILGVILILTANDGLSPHPVIYGVLSKLTDDDPDRGSGADHQIFYWDKDRSKSSRFCDHIGKYAVCDQNDRKFFTHSGSAADKNGKVHRRFKASDHF